MTPQEAINDVEDRLRLLKKYAFRDYEKQEIKALSIVLESAKLFHEVATPLPMLDGIEMKLEYESRWLMPEEVEAIGLKFEYIDDEGEYR